MTLVWVVTAFFLPQVALRIILAVVFLGLAAAAYYCSRSSVVVSQARGEVVVRNPLRTRTIPIGDIAGFDVDSHFARGNLGSRVSAVRLLRTDGSQIRCAGATAQSSYLTCVRMARQLNGAVGRRQEPAGHPRDEWDT